MFLILVIWILALCRNLKPPEIQDFRLSSSNFLSFDDLFDSKVAVSARTHNQRVSFDFDVTNKNTHSCILYTLRPSSVTKLSNEHIHINIKMNVQACTRLSFLLRTRQKVASRGEQSTPPLMMIASRHHDAYCFCRA